jgi:hypothetical protein
VTTYNTANYTPNDYGPVIAQGAETPGELRWDNGTLQQKWTTRVYYAGGAEAAQYEWRDVPSTTPCDGVE